MDAASGRYEDEFASVKNTTELPELGFVATPQLLRNVTGSG
jgi:hypothetical protein